MVKTYNDALEWAAKWIEDTLRAGPETDERTIEFGTDMAMTLRAAKLSDADLPRATADDSILRPLCSEHPHVRFVEGVLGGVQPLIARHRIGVSHLLGRMAIGMSVAEYQETWGFNDDAIKDAFAYAQDVIDALIVRERATPCATGETTVEAALTELRGTYPNRPIFIRRCDSYYPPDCRDGAETEATVAIKIGYSESDPKFIGLSVKSCMAQVRVATRTEGEGEKSNA